MPKNVKLLEGNIGGKWYDMGFGNNFLDIKSKAQQQKRRQVGQCKIKDSNSKGNYQQSKRPSI